MPTDGELDLLREGFRESAFVAQDSCPVCNGRGGVVSQAEVIHPSKRVTFDLRRCESCRHRWVDPMPTQPFLSYLYQQASNAVIGVSWETESRTVLTEAELQVSAGEAAASVGAYFELGVGKGLLYQQFIDRGWRCAGVEPGGWGSHLPGVVSSLDQAPVGELFDVIVAIDVLEHVVDPVATLTKLAGLATPSATIYASFPNADSFRSRVQRGKWRMVRPLGHVHYFSKSSTEHMFSRAGLTVQAQQTSDLVELSWRQPRSVVFAAAQTAGLGDQWFVRAAVGSAAK